MLERAVLPSDDADDAPDAQRRILIVDDDEDFADSLRDLLEPKGYVIRNVDTAEQAHASLLRRDRKSTRLNSSHANISYAVFCLKKKKTLDSNHTTVKMLYTAI